MMLGVLAARSSPGVTTSALALASVWPGSVVIVEASEDGGCLAARFGLALEPGLTTLAAAARRGSDPATVRSHTQELPGTEGRVQALVAPPGAESAATLWRTADMAITSLLTASAQDVLVIVDAGRLGAQPRPAGLLAACDRLLLVARPIVEDLQAVAHRLQPLRESDLTPELVMVGTEPYAPDEIAATLGCEVIGVLADDRPSAQALAGLASSRRLRRSPLLRSTVPLAEALLGRDVRAVNGVIPPMESLARPFTAARP